jgi:hypothetical protein
MGFGSYDESEQDKQDIDDDNGVQTGAADHEGEVEYEIGASNDELLDRLKDIKDET